jgi:hypothetical protein
MDWFAVGLMIALVVVLLFWWAQGKVPKKCRFCGSDIQPLERTATGEWVCRDFENCPGWRARQ